MKERDAFVVVALACAIGVLGFFSLRILDTLWGSFSFAQESTGGLLLPLPQPSEIAKREVFLAPLSEEEITNLRDVFSFAYSYGGAQDVLPLPEDGESSVESPQETLPAITLKGVVISPKHQVVVVDVDGEIFFLTPEKPLSGDLRLVKVDKKQVILMYRGREFVFSFEE